MAVYIVTGKLGSGKTLLCVQKILDYLKAGRKVAVNVDVFMDKLCKPGNKHSRLVRLTDLPTAEDLIGLGYGCETYNEEQFGGIFLDEGGVWLNSRDWNDKGRTDLLKFFLFLRKRRWDLWLCVQNVNVIDKQIRESIAEHVVYLNRWDRMKAPFFIRIPGRILTLGFWNGRLPKVHQAIVKYGAKHNSPKVEDWFYRGEDFYSFYDTTQEYDKGYDKGSYSMLPPGYWRRPRPAAPRTPGFYMRTTKIFFRRTRVVNAFFFGGLLSLVACVPVFATLAVVTRTDSPAAQIATSTDAPQVETANLADDYKGLRITSYGQLPGGAFYVFTDASGHRVTLAELAAQGVSVEFQGPRQVQLERGSDSLTVYR